MSQIVKKGLRCHAAVGAKYCIDCPYSHPGHCVKELADDALAYIETLEARLQRSFDFVWSMGKFECPPGSLGCEDVNPDCNKCWKKAMEEYINDLP